MTENPLRPVNELMDETFDIGGGQLVAKTDNGYRTNSGYVFVPPAKDYRVHWDGYHCVLEYNHRVTRVNARVPANVIMDLFDSSEDKSDTTFLTKILDEETYEYVLSLPHDIMAAFTEAIVELVSIIAANLPRDFINPVGEYNSL